MELKANIQFPKHIAWSSLAYVLSRYHSGHPVPSNEQAGLFEDISTTGITEAIRQQPEYQGVWQYFEDWLENQREHFRKETLDLEWLTVKKDYVWIWKDLEDYPSDHEAGYFFDPPCSDQAYPLKVAIQMYLEFYGYNIQILL